MANISVYDLRPAGADLFDGSENYLQELSDIEINYTTGGIWPVLFTISLLILCAGPGGCDGNGNGAVKNVRKGGGTDGGTDG
jgi:hypothetical protein